MIKVLKASAGSGKTYALAGEYIRLILASDLPDAYRHVLAVTFTNKATDEMKRRILKELNVLATDTSRSNYLDYLKDVLKKDERQIQERARQQLSAILNDYSSFAVSTIDRFFQQALRAFSREIGQFASYQVQLDRKALEAESVDRVLDGLTEENRELLDWMQDSVQDQLERNGSFSLEKELNEMAAGLRDIPAGEGLPRASIADIRACCRAVRKSFEERVRTAAASCLQVLEGKGIDPCEDTSNHFMKYLSAYRDAKGEIGFPTPGFMTKAADKDKWFASKKAHLKDVLGNALDGPMQAFLDCFGQPFKEYTTAGIILGQVYGLGVAAELRDAFLAVQKENNLLSLDDSNAILKGIIDNTDAPFIYEKLGVRFEDFLLDEFQDTSQVQWDNFLPLLENAVASGKDSLVVGDVKQSIYRFRGSDWKLLHEGVGNNFSQREEVPLRGNWRTCRAIVDFNNRFFSYAAGVLDRMLETDVIGTIYQDVEQEVRLKETADGSVDVCYVEDQQAELLRTLWDVHGRGGLWSDIAILVRDNKSGEKVAAQLLQNDIPVVSDDSLSVKSSVTVRRLVSQLSLVEASPDEDGKAVAGYLARKLDLHFPDGYHSLPDLAEALLRELRKADPGHFESEIPYIQSFMDYLQDWTATGGNNPEAFLRDWQAADPQIASPRLGNAVRVMTIHKAKGLEFPFVIVPFAEKVTLFKENMCWRKPVLKGSSLEGKADGTYRVNLSGKSTETLFEAAYRQERLSQAVDNLNIFYVALTRAQYGLKVIASPVAKGRQGSSNLSQILYDFVGNDVYSSGTPYDFSKMKRPVEDAAPLEAGFASFPADSGQRLRFSPEAADYFGADGSVGLQASRRIRGTVLHAILASVQVQGDVDGAVSAAVAAGELPETERDATVAFLEERIGQVEDKGWFNPAVKVLSEAALIGPDGREYRPDRVVLHPDGRVSVIDYKFGEHNPAYMRQVRRYMDLYKKRGHVKVDGWLWYLEDNFITFVN
ncbi:MAG: UvrD-helicase domain-containing protein [Bacteroidales bacterium]|nr:UvrD-helicase domain-containing protein [Bacteroidales bacterium]